jgi:hypothetical protein
MTLAERVAEYEKKGFASNSAAVVVLLEEATAALFSKYPNTFVLFGGASLVFFHGSVRHSADLDLLVTANEIPPGEQLAKVLMDELKDASTALFGGPLNVSVANANKLLASCREVSLFSVDMTKIASIIKTEVVTEVLPRTTVKAPTKNLLLLHKAEAFLTRSRLKARDAFDIRLLLDSGAELDANLKAHLSDTNHDLLDSEFLSERISQIDSKKCEADLEPFLPNEVYKELKASGFESLRAALKAVFSDWL